MNGSNGSNSDDGCSQEEGSRSINDPIPRFEVWQQYEEMAIHFNELLIKVRTGALGAVAGIAGLIGAVTKGASGETQYEVMFFTFAILSLFWLAIWILDFRYYNHLLKRTVFEIEEIEKKPLSEPVDTIEISSRIEGETGKVESDKRSNLEHEWGRNLFYFIVLLALGIGAAASGYAAKILSYKFALASPIIVLLVAGILVFGPRMVRSLCDCIKRNGSEGSGDDSDSPTIVDVESPYSAQPRDDEEQVKRNILYARIACRWALNEGYIPYASHLFFTQPGILDDDDDAERDQGIEAGNRIAAKAAEKSLFFLDLGESKGMKRGRRAAEENDREIEEIELFKDIGPDATFDDVKQKANEQDLIPGHYERTGWGNCD